MTKLRVSDELALPEDAVTRTFVVYGGKGKGKTNFGSVLVEELAKRRLRFCVTDPLDVWWGLQHGRTKDGQGIDVMILGGAHGDRAIHPGAGEVLADFVADEDVSTVIVMRHADGRMWTNGERIRFMTAFVRRLFARQGERRRPLMLVVDEAGRFVPQTAGKGDIQIAECIGALEELVEWGRNVGIGCCLITQRSARMNKSVSELAECMVAFQTAGPNSVAAIVDWFGEHIERERQKELIGILRKLPVGRALVVSPEWLDFEAEAQIRIRETFDSSATPKAGGALRAPGKARKPDLAKYEARIAEVEEQAKANDPAMLRKERADQTRRIRELEAEVARLATRPEKVAPAKPIEVPVLKNGTTKDLMKLISRAIHGLERIDLAADKLVTAAASLREVKDPLAAVVVQIGGELHRIQSAPSAGATTSGTPEGPRRGRSVDPGSSVVAPAVRAGNGGGDSISRPTSALSVGSARESVRQHAPGDRPARTTEGISGPQQRILDALAFLEHFGIQPARRSQAALVAEVSSTSSGFEKNVGVLRREGLITFPSDGMLGLSDAGRAAANAPDLGLTLAQLHESLYRRVSTPQAAILRVLIHEYPGILTRDEIAQGVGVSVTSSGFEKNVGTLRSLGLAEFPDKGHVRASDALFPQGLA